MGRMAGPPHAPEATTPTRSPSRPGRRRARARSPLRCPVGSVPHQRFSRGTERSPHALPPGAHAVSQTVDAPERTAASKPPATALRYEVQALRALAVLLVVLFHFWPGRLPGGYVGVDVFF